MERVSFKNCLKMYIYGHAHNYEPLKTQAFNVLDANWSHFESTNLLIDMMKTNPAAVLEILNRLHKKKSGFVIQAPQVSERHSSPTIHLFTSTCLNARFFSSSDELEDAEGIPHVPRGHYQGIRRGHGPHGHDSGVVHWTGDPLPQIHLVDQICRVRKDVRTFGNTGEMTTDGECVCEDHRRPLRALLACC